MIYDYQYFLPKNYTIDHKFFLTVLVVYNHFKKIKNKTDTKNLKFSYIGSMTVLIILNI